MRDSNRITTTKEHFGNAGNNKYVSYVEENIQPSRRPELDPDIKHASNLHAKQGQNEVKSNRITTYEDSVLTNNRISTQHNKETLWNICKCG